MIRTPAGKIRIKSITHHRHAVCCSRLYRDLGCHSLNLCQLIFPSVRHKYRTCSDRTVEHFHKAFLGAHIKVSQNCKPLFFYIRYFFTFKQTSFTLRDLHLDRSFLMSAVGIKERTGNINDLFPPPYKYKPGFLCDHRNFCRFKILFCRIFHKLIRILRINYNRHSFLRFGNCNFCSVKSRIFLRHFVQFHAKAGSKFTDCHRYSARAKVVALLDQTADFFSSEKALNLSLCRRISLLNFCPACLN